MIAKAQRFLLSMLDPDGRVSFGRSMSLMSLVACLSWDTANVFFAWSFNHHLPPGIGVLPLLPDSLTLVGQTGFCTAFYGVTKFADVTHDTDGRKTEDVKVEKQA